jgi:glucan-binding repeat-containing protein
MKKRRRRYVLLTLSLILFLYPCTSFAMTEEEAIKQVETSYENSKKAAGVSTFKSDLCVDATRKQMEQVGLIGVGNNDDCPRGNGNQWYDNYKPKDGQKTSKGYTIHCVDTLNALLNTYGQPLYNIVVSYGSGGKNGNNHVMFIHAIINNTVYFTDNYSYAGTPEGKAWPSISVERYNEIYEGMYGRAKGVVYFEKNPEFPEEWIWDTQFEFWKYQLSDGTFAKGWKSIDGHTYYFKNDTSLVHSGWYEIVGEWYYFNSDGHMQTGWQKVDGEWYYLNDSGIMQKNKIVEKSGVKYYLGSNGAISKNMCITINGIEYDADNSGKLTQLHNNNISEKSQLKITGETKPGTLKIGDYFGLDGIITSNYQIQEVHAQILDSSGNTVQWITVYPGTTEYRLNGEVDESLIFNYLSAGRYTYTVTAKDSSGNEKKLISKSFSVQEPKAEKSTLKITGATKPTKIQEGSFFGLDGTISSNYSITKVYGAINTSNGQTVQEITVYPNTMEYRLNGEIDNSLIFNYLSEGSYRYVIIASDNSGKEKKLINQSFKVVK